MRMTATPARPCPEERAKMVSSTCGVLVSDQLAWSLVLFFPKFGLLLCDDDANGAAAVKGQAGSLEEESAGLWLGAVLLIRAVEAGRKEEEWKAERLTSCRRHGVVIAGFIWVVVASATSSCSRMLVVGRRASSRRREQGGCLPRHIPLVEELGKGEKEALVLLVPSFLTCGCLCVCVWDREGGQGGEEASRRAMLLVMTMMEGKSKQNKDPNHTTTTHTHNHNTGLSLLVVVPGYTAWTPWSSWCRACLALRPCLHSLYSPRKPTKKPRRFFTPCPQSHTTTHTPHTGTHPPPPHPTA